MHFLKVYFLFKCKVSDQFPPKCQQLICTAVFEEHLHLIGSLLPSVHCAVGSKIPLILAEKISCSCKYQCSLDELTSQYQWASVHHSGLTAISFILSSLFLSDIHVHAHMYTEVACANYCTPNFVQHFFMTTLVILGLCQHLL